MLNRTIEKENSPLDNEVELLSREVANLKSTIVLLKGENAGLTRGSIQLSNRIEQLIINNEKLLKRFRESELNLTELKVGTSNSILNSLRRRINGLEQDLDKEKKTVKLLQWELRNYRGAGKSFGISYDNKIINKKTEGNKELDEDSLNDELRQVLQSDELNARSLHFGR